MIPWNTNQCFSVLENGMASRDICLLVIPASRVADHASSIWTRPVVVFCVNI